MGDLNERQASQTVRVVGDDEVNCAEVNSDKRLGVFNDSMRTSGAAKAPMSSLVAGQDGTFQRPLLTDSAGRLITTSEVLSQFPSFKQFLRKSLAAGAILYGEYLMAANTAIKEFHIGGRGPCEGILAKDLPSNQDIIGAFESPAAVAAWTNTGIGSSSGLTWAYATDQFFFGSASAKVTFTQSDGNNYPELTLTFSSPRDLSLWRYVNAAVRVTVATGGNQTRQVQIRLNSGTATRVYRILGSTTTAPFNTEQWHAISGEIETPHLLEGTGSFDINSVNSISLRLLDGGNKSGTIWWDYVRFTSEIQLVDKIYSSDGSTNQLRFDPVVPFTAGETLLIGIKNTGTLTTEIQGSASGVTA